MNLARTQVPRREDKACGQPVGGTEGRVLEKLRDTQAELHSMTVERNQRRKR